MIRNAQLNDFEHLYDLIMSASKVVFSDALQTSDEKELKKFVKECYSLEESKFSYTNTIVYEMNDEIVGCLISYSSDDEQHYNTNMEKLLNNDYKFCLETINNTCYLDTIAVSEKYQGMGIAKKLIQHLIDNSQSNVSLVAESYKKNVIAFYKKLGFTIIEETKMFGQDVTTMLFVK